MAGQLSPLCLIQRENLELMIFTVSSQSQLAAKSGQEAAILTAGRRGSAHGKCMFHLARRNGEHLQKEKGATVIAVRHLTTKLVWRISRSKTRAP